MWTSSGSPAKKVLEDGRSVAVPGCKIFMGGKIGEDAHLSLEPIKDKIPLDDLLPELVDILVTHFGATKKAMVSSS
jgi:ferredoxin-nitrite reductase